MSEKENNQKGLMGQFLYKRDVEELKNKAKKSAFTNKKIGGVILKGEKGSGSTLLMKKLLEERANLLHGNSTIPHAISKEEFIKHLAKHLDESTNPITSDEAIKSRFSDIQIKPLSDQDKDKIKKLFDEAQPKNVQNSITKKTNNTKNNL